jgi:K+-transporting ATPase ATPase C chain
MHPDLVQGFIKDNPGTPQPKAADLAVVFFEDFSARYPGKFPAVVTGTGLNGRTARKVDPVNAGADIQSIFFDMWRDEHPDAELRDVPADMITASASGLDPHISLQNALFQLDRVASKWAADKKRPPEEVRKEVELIVRKNASAPWDGIAGERYVNVLEINLELRKQYGEP